MVGTWYCCIGGLWAPLLLLLGYRPLDLEFLALGGITVVPALLAAAASRLSSALAALLAALTLFLFLDLYLIDVVDALIGVINFGLLAIPCWLLRRRIITALGAGVLAFTVSVALTAQPLDPVDWSRAPAAHADSQLPPVIHLILDEHCGTDCFPPGVMTDDERGTEQQAFVARGFAVWSGVRSTAINTRPSLSAMMNPESARPEQLLTPHSRGYEFALTKNSYFERMLQAGYRIRVLQSSYLNFCAPIVSDAIEFNKYLDVQLKRLQVEHIDIYLLHAMRQSYWENYKKLDVFKFLDEAKKQGKILCAGFSFHDQLALFKEITDSYGWDMCQIQLNYLDEHMQAGLEGLKYADSKGIPVVIMEPLKGGSLVNNLPGEVTEFLRKYGGGINPVSLALRYLCSLPEAAVILSGVSSMSQLKEDIEIFNDMPIGPLEDKESELVNRVRDLIKSKIKIGCTGCGYCMPCPSGVAIPDLFKLYNDVYMLDHLKVSKIFYKVFENGKRAQASVQNVDNVRRNVRKHLKSLKA